MTSKKSLLTFTCIFFVSLYSPIRAETTNKERLFRALNYAYWGGSVVTVFKNDEPLKCKLQKDELLRIIARAITATGISLLADEGMDKYIFTESDRHQLGNERFLVNLAVGGAAIVCGFLGSLFDDKDSKMFAVLGCSVGGAVGGLSFSYFLEQRVKNNRFEELEKITKKKKKEREADVGD